MSYEPQEGVDYLIDLYSVAGVDSDADPKDIKKATDKLLAGYHPDRLESLAPEFQRKGAHMARLLNRARGILLNPKHRSEYDAIREAWTGPFSNDGTPVITISRATQAEMERMGVGEIEATFAKTDKQIDTMAPSASARIAFFERMIVDSQGEMSEDLRREYESALLEEDRNLAIKESRRADLLGYTNPSEYQFRVTSGYGNTIAQMIEARKVEHVEEARAIALGRTVQRLAILSGEATDVIAEIDPDTISVPGYFGPVAEQVTDLAQRREAILDKRLSIFEPEYPEAELQEEAQPRLIVGIQSERPLWLAFDIDLASLSFDAVDVPEDVVRLLEAGDTKAAIEHGFNVLTIPMMEHINLHTLLETALEKYYEKYHPELDE